MDGNNKPKYIPPHKRGQPQSEPSKFAKFLQNKESRWQKVKAESDWGRRDGRNGTIDQQEIDEEEELFAKHSSGSKSNLERYEDMPVEISEHITPFSSFEECEPHPRLCRNVQMMQYSKLTPVQKYSIPICLHPRDLMACAQTGSGKTAAYLFPVLVKMLKNGPPQNYSTGRKSHPVALILAPTRELSIQIHDEARKFAHMTGIRVVVVYGGADPKTQGRELDRGADIVVATTGRLIDFINRGRIELDLLQYLVLDEADRMLDMGFEPQIRQIMSHTPRENRDTIMCSATFPKNIQNLAAQFMNEYVFLTIGRVGSTAENIKQQIHYVEDEDKREYLHEFLQKTQGLVLIFVETKRTADFLNEYLYECGYASTSIHGDRTQPEREKALSDFKSKKAPILVATDVAARGLDIPNVSNVINYDAPNNIDDYVQRIGRTGRAGKDGLAVTLLNDKNIQLAKDLYTLLCETKQEIPSWFEQMYRQQVISQKRGGRGNRRGSRYTDW